MRFDVSGRTFFFFFQIMQVSWKAVNGMVKVEDHRTVMARIGETLESMKTSDNLCQSKTSHKICERSWEMRDVLKGFPHRSHIFKENSCLKHWSLTHFSLQKTNLSLQIILHVI